MSEALRLADELEYDWGARFLLIKSASELRRLHAENERLRQINQSHEMKLSVRGYEIQIDDLKALTAELVEALRWYVDTDEVMEMEGNEFWLDGRERARAALAKVEASK